MSPDRDDGLHQRAKAQLLDEIEAFFAAPPPKQQQAPVPRQRTNLAAAWLLVEMIRADQASHHDEHLAVAAAIERALGLSEEETAALIRLAEEEQRAGRPLQHFTSLVDAQCSLAQKRQIVEALWRVAFADAELLAHEEYFVRKISDLIHLPFEDFLLAKIDAREAFFDGA
jgi:uncharacterized tellurite resistance protein B-like protein